MTSTGLPELRQRASELVRQAEAGEVVTVSVDGRPVAELAPVRRDQWRSWSDVAHLFDGPADLSWPEDRELVEDDARGPSAP